MRAIRKGTEPASLTEYRATEDASFPDLPGQTKKDLRKALVEEQQGLCCYCTSRIKNQSDKVRIEHWQCQADNPDIQLSYNNLLGACPGAISDALQDHHCDRSKGSQAIEFNPANPSHAIEHRIMYLATGKIDSDNEQFAKQIGEVLNLNHTRLTDNRKSYLDSFLQWYKAKRRDKQQLQRKLDKLTPGDGVLEPFSPVVVALLRKKLGVTA